jgi:hypothetical protein
VSLAVAQGELHVDRRVLDVVVLDLVVRDGGLASRALRDGALALLDQSALVGLLEPPPRGLHVLGVDSFIRVVPVHPDAE